MLSIWRISKWTPLGFAVFLAGCTAADITTPGGNVSVRTLGGAFTARSADGSVFSTDIVSGEVKTPVPAFVQPVPPPVVPLPPVVPPPVVFKPLDSIPPPPTVVETANQRADRLIRQRLLFSPHHTFEAPGYRQKLKEVETWYYVSTENQKRLQDWVLQNENEILNAPIINGSQYISNDALGKNQRLLWKAIDSLAIPTKSPT